MRKAFIVMIVVILLFGVSGCGSVSAEQGELQIASKYAWCIVDRINTYNALRPSEQLGYNVYNFGYDITMEEAKEKLTDDGLWLTGLSDEEESAAWELIVYKDGLAELTPEARDALQEGTRYESDHAKTANAKIIAADINLHNSFDLNSMFPDNVTLAEVKETLGDWWPFLTEAEVNEAWELIEIKDGVATVKREG